MAFLQRQGTAQVETFGRQGQAILHQIYEQVMAAQQENVGTFHREMAEMQRSFQKNAAQVTAKIAEVRLLSSSMFSY